MGQRLQKIAEQAALVSLNAVVLDLWMQSVRPSKFKSSNGFATGWFVAVADAIHLQLEVSIGEGWWSDARLLDLTPADGPSGKRKQDASMAYKEAVVKAAREMPNKIDPRHIMDVTSLKEGREPAEVPNHRGTASQATQDEALAYLASSRVIFREPRSLHFTFDGVRAAGEENVIFVAWLPRADVAAIPPLQAGWGGKTDSESFAAARHESTHDRGTRVRPPYDQSTPDPAQPLGDLSVSFENQYIVANHATTLVRLTRGSRDDPPRFLTMKVSGARRPFQDTHTHTHTHRTL